MKYSIENYKTSTGHTYRFVDEHKGANENVYVTFQRDDSIMIYVNKKTGALAMEIASEEIAYDEMKALVCLIQEVMSNNSNQDNLSGVAELDSIMNKNESNTEEPDTVYHHDGNTWRLENVKTGEVILYFDENPVIEIDNMNVPGSFTYDNPPSRDKGKCYYIKYKGAYFGRDNYYNWQWLNPEDAIKFYDRGTANRWVDKIKELVEYPDAVEVKYETDYHY